MAKKATPPPVEESPTFIGQSTKYAIIGIALFAIALFLSIAAFGKAGVAGDVVYRIFRALFGIGYALFPLSLILLGSTFMTRGKPLFIVAHSISAGLFLLSGLGAMFIIETAFLDGAQGQQSGYLGYALGWPFYKLFDTYVGLLFLVALLSISLLILFDRVPNIPAFIARIRTFFGRTPHSQDDIAITAPTIEESPLEEEALSDEEEVPTTTPIAKKVQEKIEAIKESVMAITPSYTSGTYVPPPISLLEKDKGRPHYGDVKMNANTIKQTFKNFGIDVEMDEVTIGPTVTRYAMKPAQGVRLSRIVVLQNELALALAAPSVLIQAPIPGKSLVGIEIPNETKQVLGLNGLIGHTDFAKSPHPLTVALGKDVTGRAHYANIAKMPHLLIAGTTGSGKSVTLHTLIASLLYRNGPEDLRFIMVDPKRVELPLYSKIPHLLTPVITDPKKAILTLKWAVSEMERRYDLLAKLECRDIKSYHELRDQHNKDLDEGDERYESMPYIVIIIDELSDLMSTYPRELEAGIVRLAQMSRAVGIHLILSTQRPDANVITGLIKANIPARIALKVSSRTNSQIIIDTIGAEKLLGYGDMLYHSGEKEMERIQCPYLSEAEIKKIVAHIASHHHDAPDTIDIGQSASGSTLEGSIFESGALGNDSDDDELYEDVRRAVIESKKASTSYIQRKFKVGYSRGARLMDLLEERGVIGPANGSKSREVLETDGGGGFGESSYEE